MVIDNIQINIYKVDCTNVLVCAYVVLFPTRTIPPAVFQKRAGGKKPDAVDRETGYKRLSRT